MAGRIPTRVSMQPLGSTNTAVPGRVVPPPITLVKGPALPIEQFNHPDVHPAVARALNQIQQNVLQALGQVKAHPTANSNLIQGVKLVQGNNFGTPFNIIAHGLGVDYTSFQLTHTEGGGINVIALINDPATLAKYPKNKYICIWTQFNSFSIGPPAPSCYGTFLVFA